jgi:hypothetical protein
MFWLSSKQLKMKQMAITATLPPSVENKMPAINEKTSNKLEITLRNVITKMA